MIPSQLLRALATACRVAGVPHPGTVPDDASHDDALDLLDQLAEAVDRDRPGYAPPEPRALSAQAERVAELAAAGRSDPQIAAELGVTAAAVRSVRRYHGIAAGTQPGPSVRSGWEARLREAHARGLGLDDLARELGWTAGTVRTRLSGLGLLLPESQQLLDLADRGLTVEQIAAELGQSADAVRARLASLARRASRPA